MKKLLRKLLLIYETRIDFEKYWKRRMAIQNLSGGVLKKIYIILLRRQESKFNSSTGIGLGTKESPCCTFKQPAYLPHGLYGIVIARNVIFEGKVSIYQNVTISEADKTKKTFIGNNVMIGAGAIILNNSRIGNNVKIGANAVVVQDIPDNCSAVGVPARIIKN
ncbi:serine O-acetyltransferase [uncultured Fusobacterium sp.]|uniref:serine O-acetyltransferase n=1 Tax=uncultured Fusobacterium sp. TaxID=159267 RepID=UPI0015A588BE|nr:transferase [uncultured Fusobacterium sp.]